MPTCPHCGAVISHRDPVCPWCGAPNPDYQPPADEINVLLENGMTAYQQQQYALAADYYQRVIEQDPEIFDAYFYLAASLTALGRVKEAIKTMQKARMLRPNSAPIDYNLGMLYKRMGNRGEARHYLEQALEKVAADPALQHPQEMRSRIQRELALLKE